MPGELQSAITGVRCKFVNAGPGALSDVEILALLLCGCVRSGSCLDAAQRLLADKQTLRALLQASEAEISGFPGLGLAAFTRLQVVMEIARRQLREVLEDSNPLTSPDLTRRYLQARLRDRSREIFAAMFLDNRHRVRVFEELFKGTLDGAAVYPRVVAEKSLRYRAAAVIVAHNHPSGVAEPSQADVALTRRLKDALALIDIRLLDHFIVGDGTPVSLAERGLI
jgi:DNA repair protein RadC